MRGEPGVAGLGLGAPDRPGCCGEAGLGAAGAPAVFAGADAAGWAARFVPSAGRRGIAEAAGLAAVVGRSVRLPGADACGRVPTTISDVGSFVGAGDPSSSPKKSGMLSADGKSDGAGVGVASSNPKKSITPATIVRRDEESVGAVSAVVLFQVSLVFWSSVRLPLLASVQPTAPPVAKQTPNRIPTSLWR